MCWVKLNCLLVMVSLESFCWLESRLFFWLIMVICDLFSFGILVVIRLMIVIIWFGFRLCFGYSLISIEVLGLWLLWMNIEFFGIVRCMWVVLMLFRFDMVCVSLFFRLWWQLVVFMNWLVFSVCFLLRILKLMLLLVGVMLVEVIFMCVWLRLLVLISSVLELGLILQGMFVVVSVFIIWFVLILLRLLQSGLQFGCWDQSMMVKLIVMLVVRLISRLIWCSMVILERLLRNDSFGKDFFSILVLLFLVGIWLLISVLVMNQLFLCCLDWYLYDVLVGLDQFVVYLGYGLE